MDRAAFTARADCLIQEVGENTWKISCLKFEPQDMMVVARGEINNVYFAFFGNPVGY
jgi:hypothetical protein